MVSTPSIRGLAQLRQCCTHQRLLLGIVQETVVGPRLGAPVVLP